MEKIKQCPYCAEDIKAAAIVCKHCGRQLPEYKPLSSNKITAKNQDGRNTEANPSIWAVGRKWALWIALASCAAIPIDNLNTNLNALMLRTIIGVPLNYLFTLGLVALITWISRNNKWKVVLLSIAILVVVASLLVFFSNDGFPFASPAESINSTPVLQITRGDEITYNGLQCIHYSNLPYSKLGLNTCVYGRVKSYGPDTSSWNTIDFGPSNTGIRVVDNNNYYTTPLDIGACVRVYGRIFFQEYHLFIVPDNDAKDSILVLELTSC